MRIHFNKHLIVANKTPKPQMKNVNGKEWKSFPVTMGKQKVTAHQDVNYGEYFFFQWKDKSWYGCRIIQLDSNTGAEVKVDITKGKVTMNPIERYQRETV